jgi:flavin reductase (DIM6/NTAB) family NADH-FMN oxidoreductase RutF
MRKIDPQDIGGNAFDRIGKQWFLLTAGETGQGGEAVSRETFNTMTGAWGGFGVMWNLPVAFAVVRPQRHTFGFMEKAERYTLSFFPEEYRQALALCGKRSGRDTDKPAETGLRPAEPEPGVWTFEQAEITVVCRKLYADFLKENAFLDVDLPSQWYPEKDYHKLYVGSIEAVYRH